MAPFYQVFKDSYGINLFSSLYSVQTKYPDQIILADKAEFKRKFQGMNMLIDLHSEEVTALTDPSMVISVTSAWDFVQAGEVLSSIYIYPGTRL